MLIFVGVTLLVALYAAVTTSVVRALAGAVVALLLFALALFANGQGGLAGAVLWAVGGGALLFFYMIAMVVDLLPHQRGARRLRWQAVVHLGAGAWTASLALALLWPSMMSSTRAPALAGAVAARAPALDVATTGLGVVLLLVALSVLLVVRRRT